MLKTDAGKGLPEGVDVGKGVFDACDSVNRRPVRGVEEGSGEEESLAPAGSSARDRDVTDSVGRNQSLQDHEQECSLGLAAVADEGRPGSGSTTPRGEITMQQVWTVLNEGRQEIENHPFFRWLNSDSVPLTGRFIFSPVMIDFIMSFADLNKWFLRYEDPRGEFETSINEHTEEDATHSRLFVRNWSHLKLGDTLDWPASKGLWWMFHSKQSLVVRRFGMDVLKLAVNFPDPMVRFSMMEAIEICGDVFFANTAPIAKRLEDQQQVEHIYYGQYHRERETGHLQSDEGCFVNARLSPEQRAQAEDAVRVVYDHFLKVLDRLVEFSQRAVSDYRGLQRAIESEYVAALDPPLDARSTKAPYSPCALSHVPHPNQVKLLDLLSERRSRLGQHPFLAWLRNGPPSPLERLQGFTPLWGIDIVGYKDFNDIVLRYPNPQSTAEMAINRWAEQLATHGVLYLQDWKALRLDAILGWRMVDAIAYYFLSEHTEVHRRNMAKVKKHAMRNTAPLVRWWLMLALEEGGKPLFEATKGIALDVEEDLGITLNYWAGRHELVEVLGQHDLQFPFLQQEVTDEQSAVIEQIIRTVFDNLEEQFELSYSTARSGIFSTRPQSLPPPRVSEIVVIRSPADSGTAWMAVGGGRR